MTAVELRTEEALRSVDRLPSMISVEVGEPLDPAAVRHSLRSLRAAVEGAEVEAHVAPRGDGVEVVFAIWTQVRVAEVRLEGELCVKEETLRPLLDQRAGAPLSESRVLRGLYRLEELHVEGGFLDYRVRLEVTDAGEGRVAVVYRMDCGVLATVGDVAFEGDLGPFGPADLIELLEAAPGRRYQLPALRRDVDALESWLIGEGYRQVRVGEPRVDYEADTTEVHLTYPLELGPRFEVRVSGADADQLRRKGLLPFVGTERYDEAILLQAIARLRRYYQELGHYRVEIERRIEHGEDLQRIWLRIEPGPVYDLSSVVLTGYQWVSGEELEERLATGRRRLLTASGGRLVDEVLEEDLEAIRSYLALQGFDRATVGPPVVEEEGDRLSVTVPISEGRRRRVVHVEIRGAESLPESELRSVMRLAPGGPFHPRLLDESLNRVRARYEELGYARIQVSAEVTWNETGTLADVELAVLEGPRTRVDQVILRGNLSTSSEVVLRTAGFERGDPVSRNDLLEAQRRLYALGIFSRVDVELGPGGSFDGRRDVIVRVEEGKDQKVSYGFGWDSESGFRVVFGYSHANLRQRAVTGRFDLRWSQRDRQGRLLFHQPYVAGWRLPSTYSIFAIEEEQDSFTSQRTGLQAEASRVGRDARFNLLYTYKVVQLEDLDPALEQIEIDRELQEVELSSITPALLVDRRDDPILPRRGWSAALSTELAFPFLDADAEFVKGFGQHTAYLDFGRFGVLAASARLGAIEPTGSNVQDPTLPPDRPSRLVPISERFFAGGRTTHRAYRRDRLGIPGETLLETDDGLVSVGGNGMLLFNFDLRVPIAGPIGGLLFVDAGNVWADWRDVRLDELKPGIGLGVRYLSPVGPLRLEVGWKLDRETGEDPAVLFLSFGNPF